jgi:GNAT superfamily N-acetyltransferase
VWLGTSSALQSKGYGTHLLNITKLLFISGENRTGCRLITVDARNDERTLNFYRNNGFEYRSPKLTPDKRPDRNTFPMFFDLAGDWEYDPNSLEPVLPDGAVYNSDLRAKA